MASLLTRLKEIFGATPAFQSLTRVSIVSEDDFESDKALLQHLSDSPINRYVPDQDSGASAYTGSNRKYRFDFRLGYLGIVGPKRWLVANGLLFSDSDAFIVVADAFNPYIRHMLKDCLELSAKGTVNSKPMDFYPTTKKGIPWLILVNFRGEPLDKQKAQEQVELLQLDALDVDWHFCPVSTTSGAGIDDAASLLRKKLDTLGSKWQDIQQ
ncbi:hypothetical protein N7520_007745 [Penicillium odoratum]|uniref:uncharacterized protein n=1 Tax=Penicillium odoratum TaxID=1167516 RepID=UPI0025481F26|nr:uncharacterized protein N7520_007745 [Penicillium odoratum]KAJ5760589.1 hypothetical protein N7520_007745 [Penicillium odoratum]